MPNVHEKCYEEFLDARTKRKGRKTVMRGASCLANALYDHCLLSTATILTFELSVPAAKVVLSGFGNWSRTIKSSPGHWCQNGWSQRKIK